MNQIKILLFIFIQEAQSYCPQVIYFRTNINDPDQLHALRRVSSKWTTSLAIYPYRLYHSYQKDDKPRKDESTTLTSKILILIKTWASRNPFAGSRPRTLKSSTGKLASHIIYLMDLHTWRIFMVTATLQARARHLFPGKLDVLATKLQDAFAAGKSFMKSQVRPRTRNCGAIAATCSTTASTLPLAEATFKIELEYSIK